jgi:hypothetical protein
MSPPLRAQLVALLGRLERREAFFARWFVTPQGRFKAAFQTFSSSDDFEAQLERLLHEWLANKVAKGRIVVWPTAVMSPMNPTFHTRVLAIMAVLRHCPWWRIE